MTLTDDLVVLTELRDRGDLSPQEFERAKQRLLGPPPLPAPPVSQGPDGALLLYRVVTTWQRRAAWVLAVVALSFGAVCAWSTLRTLDLRAQADAVEDVTLAQGFGIRIPDPRPTIERAELRVRSTAHGGLAAVTGLVAATALSGALLIRPPS